MPSANRSQAWLTDAQPKRSIGVLLWVIDAKILWDLVT